MKKLSRLLLCVVLAGLTTAWAVAQDSDTDAKSKGEVRSITGCLTQGPSANKFLLTASDGGSWEVHNNNAVDLTSHLGHTIKVKGVVSNTKMHNMKVAKVRQNWYRLIPASAEREKGKLAIEFTVLKNGQLSDMKLVASAGDASLDRAAWGGVTASNPFPALPAEFKGDHLTSVVVSITTLTATSLNGLFNMPS
jgi:TonB family protein